MFLRIAPILFVLIWSTGWLSAGFVALYADPLTFLIWRYALAALCMGAFALATRAVWPATRAMALRAMYSGVLLHAIYLGGIWWAVRHGLPASVSGALAAIQPILTAFLAPRLAGETVTPRQWAGIGIGAVGLLLTLSPKLAALSADRMAEVGVPVLVNVIAMVSATMGSFYQKKYLNGADLRATTTLQYIGAFLATLPVAWIAEPMRIEWNATLIATMAWSVLGLSLGAITIYLWLIRKGAVSKAASLIYLVPPTVAIEAWLWLGERLEPIQVAGILLSGLGVAMTVIAPRQIARA